MSTYRFPLRGKIGRGKIGVVRGLREEAPVRLTCATREPSRQQVSTDVLQDTHSLTEENSQPSGRTSLFGLVPLRATDGAISGVACKRCGGQSGDDDAFDSPHGLCYRFSLCRRTKHIGARDARWRGKMPVSISLSIPDLRETTALIGIDD